MAHLITAILGCLLAFAGCDPVQEPQDRKVNTIPHQAIGSMNDYEPIPLPRLIGIADYILMGSVHSVGKENFQFKVEGVLAGILTKKMVTVEQFVPNKFDGPRAADYSEGQQFLLFLKKDTTQNVLRVLGAGGEGEMPVDAGFVYFHGRHVEGLEKKNHQVHLKERLIQRFDYKVFEEAVKDIRQCYQCAFDTAKERYDCHKTCETQAFLNLEKKSFMHQYLAKNLN